MLLIQYYVQKVYTFYSRLLTCAANVLTSRVTHVSVSLLSEKVEMVLDNFMTTHAAFLVFKTYYGNIHLIGWLRNFVYTRHSKKIRLKFSLCVCVCVC